MNSKYGVTWLPHTCSARTDWSSVIGQFVLARSLRSDVVTLVLGTVLCGYTKPSLYAAYYML
jgi:hypothetical protein